MEILIQGELRSLIRNGLERVIGTNFKKKKTINKSCIKFNCGSTIYIYKG